MASWAPEHLCCTDPMTVVYFILPLPDEEWIRSNCSPWAQFPLPLFRRWQFLLDSNSHGSTHTGPRSEEGLFIRDTEEELKLAGSLHLNYISEAPTADTNKEKTLCHRKKRTEKEGRAEIGFKGQCRPFGAYVNTHVCAHVCACVLPRFYILLLTYI